MDVLTDTRHELGECVLWCERTGRLLWTDIPAATLWAYTPATGRTASWPMPERLCCFALTGSDDRLLLGLASGLAFFTFSSGKVTRICDVEPDIPSTRINDGRCDRQGRFVFGMFNQAEHPKHALGGFYRLNLDLSLERLPLPNAAIANSICFSPNGRRMYFADSAQKAILYADYNPCSAEVGARAHVRRGRCGAGGTRRLDDRRRRLPVEHALGRRHRGALCARRPARTDGAAGGAAAELPGLWRT